MKSFILVHYGEIGLKGSNFDYFLNKLKKSLFEKLYKIFKHEICINHVLGRLLIHCKKNEFGKDLIMHLKKIPGLKNFQFVYEGDKNLNKLSKQIIRFFKNTTEFRSSKTFVVRVKRSQLMKYSSPVCEAKIGEHLLNLGINKKVSLKNPDLTINIEFFNGHGYFSFEKIEGMGGLSSNSGNKMICLISGGIDSPVSAYRMIKRGVRIIFVHFCGYPYTDKEELEHVKSIIRILSSYQIHNKLYIVPFGQIQKEIATNLDIEAKIRVILYKRLMLKIAEILSKKNHAKGLVTGDSLGQVASQTPENLYAIHEAIKIPLYQPLISFDKEEIIKIAEEIGTYNISKLPCKDACSMFSPKHPELKADIYNILEAEKHINIECLIKSALKNVEIVYF